MSATTLTSDVLTWLSAYARYGEAPTHQRLLEDLKRVSSKQNLLFEVANAN